MTSSFIVLVGEQGYGDEFGIGGDEAVTILDVAKMYGGEPQILPERCGNRMNAEMISAKTKELGWKPKRILADYIEQCRINKCKKFSLWGLNIICSKISRLVKERQRI